MSDKPDPLWFWILEGKEVVRTDDFVRYMISNHGVDRRVAWSEVAPAIEVSTAFVGGVEFVATGPVLFETRVFGGKCNEECRFTRTWAAAERAHAAMVRKVERMAGKARG
jgi:hypothetical protein